MTTLQERAAPLLALVDASTPGPWGPVFPDGQDIWLSDYRDKRGVMIATRTDEAAIATLPDLAALLREALSEIERLQLPQATKGLTYDECAHWVKAALPATQSASCDST